MPTVVLKLFAGQGTRQTDKAATIIMLPSFGEHKNVIFYIYSYCVTIMIKYEQQTNR